MPSIAALIDTKNALIKDAMLVVERGLNVPANRDRHTEITAKIDAIEEQLSMQRRVSALLPASVATPPAPAPATRIEVVSNGNEERARMTREWRSFLVTGKFESRDLNTATSSHDGAALVPQAFAEVTEATKWYGPIAALVSRNDQATGAPVKIPVSDDTESYMTYLTENSSTSSLAQDPTLFSTIPAGFDTLISTALFSKQEAKDAQDIGKFLGSIAAARAARALDVAIVLGTDNSPDTNALPHMPSGGLIAGLTASVTGASISTAPTYAQMAALKASVDNSYRVGLNVGFLVNQTTHDAFVAAVDSTGRPLYEHDPGTGMLVVAGSLVYISPSIAPYTTASAVCATFGDYSKAFKLATDGLRVRVLTERYADIFINSCLIYQRVSGAIAVASAAMSMTTASD
jgi:HK97 family phage major capsid protein